MKCNQCGTEFNGKFCPECGAGIGATIKKKKPFFLKWWFIALVIVAIVIIIISQRDTNNAKEFEWTDIYLYESLPYPGNTFGEIGHNSETSLILTLCKVDEKSFKNYKDICAKEGYNVEPEDSYFSYSAYNSEGYSVRIVFNEISSEMNIYLDAPKKFGKFIWPNMGLGTKLPKTKSDIGDISWDNSTTFIVHVGNTPIEDYNEYVNTCIELGYTVDYSKDDEYYSAKNEDGYNLTLRYLGFNEIEISLKAPDKKDIIPVEEDTNEQEEDLPPNKTNQTANTSTENTEDKDIEPSDIIGLSPDFKEAMDSYEKFMDEYVAFMKKYKNNPMDIALIADYTDYIAKYAAFVDDFSKWEKEKLNTAEAVYYVDVQARVNKKLLEITN